MLPTFGETIYWASVVFLCYALFYTALDRICKCFENCANAKAFGQFKAAEVEATMSGEKKNGKM